MLREIEERTDNLHCPLSGELMSDPVTDADGNTFERGNILVWLEDRGCSPITNRVMTKDELRSNAILKETIIKKHELMNEKTTTSTRPLILNQNKKKNMNSKNTVNFVYHHACAHLPILLCFRLSATMVCPAF